MGIVKKGSDNFLNSVLALVIKNSRCITLRSELCLGTVGDTEACVRGETWLVRARVLKFDEKVIDVPGHAETAVPAWIIPLD